jgi:DNA repair photolyase
MRSTVIEVPPRKRIIAHSTWRKKRLAERHLEALLYCEFECEYCSSDSGLHLRFLHETLDQIVRKVTGRPFDPHNADHLVIAYSGVVAALERELDSCSRKPGNGLTLVYSQLTDGFSPVLLRTETTRRILELLLEKTCYRIRILTKSAIVGRPSWVRFFADHADRFVVGLSTGTLDSRFAGRMEGLTSRPESRLEALRNLQDAGVPTFGMLCPVFPQVLDSDELERLVDGIRPELCEHVWAEPFNERHNWKHVRDVYSPESTYWNWMTRVFGDGDNVLWSRYATDLYTRLHKKAVEEGWSEKLRYLLYEDNISKEDSTKFRGLDGVLLQSKSYENGRSKNRHFARLQADAIRR